VDAFILTAMRWLRLVFGLLPIFIAGPRSLFAGIESFSKVEVPQMKTSVYVGSVTLTMSAFERSGDVLTATYNAKVVPWPWSEKGNITIDFPEEDLERLSRGETVELKGKAVNAKNKTHAVTARAQPADASTGKLKVRVQVSGATLIFNGTYRFAEEP
jgi:hypothetical protein